MTDTVTITFTVDIAELQRGLQQATGGIAEATATMKAGAQQVAVSYADLTRAYAAGAPRSGSMPSRRAATRSWRLHGLATRPRPILR